MKMEYLCSITLLTLSVLLSATLATECPTECKCTYEQPNSHRKVDCSNAGLTSVPKLPLETKVLDLSGNSISFLPNRSFSQAPLLQSLDLSNNGLTRMEIDAFKVNDHGGELEMLNLSHNNLDADDFQDHELFRYTRLLKELDISYNNLKRIPSSGLKILTNLEKLYMSHNRMSDLGFAPEFASMELLEHIDISGNNFLEIPTHAFLVLTAVRSLNLSNCNIRRIRSDVFKELDLVDFDISDNPGINQQDLNATIHEVTSSPMVTSMRLSNVNISDLNYVLTPLLYADNFHSLDLSHNNLRQLSSADLRPAKKLRTLNISNNGLRLLPTLSLPYLQVLDASHNSISSITEQNFDTAKDLEEVILNHNQLTEFSSTPFSRNSNLRKLDMSYNNLWTVTDITLFEYLEELNLRGNSLDDPSELFMMFNLQVLDLGSNKISSLTSDMIQDRINLMVLNLTDNFINNIEADTFKYWTPATIDLSHNRLSSIDDWGMSLVRKLDLSSNGIEYISEQGIRDLRFLTELDLSDNRLNSLPLKFFSYLVDLKILDLSFNNLGTFLMSSISTPLLSLGIDSKIDLMSLNLRSNNIQNIRDYYFINLTVLTTLDLSENLLTDVKSTQLQDLSMLKTLNLSNNKLKGFNHTTTSHLVSLKILDLSGIEWTCDCSISELKKWIDTTEIDLVNYEQYKCNLPETLKGVPLADFNIEELNCGQTIMEKTIILIIIGCTSFVLLVVASIIFWQHRWRLKKKLKKQHYRAMYERAQSTQLPLTNHNTGLMTQGDYHQHITNHQSPHPYHHPSTHSSQSNHSRNHTPILAQKPPPIPTSCPEHQHSSQAFV